MYTGNYRFADLDPVNQCVCKARYRAFDGDGHLYSVDDDGVVRGRTWVDPKAPSCYAVLACAKPGSRVVLVMAGQKGVLATKYDKPSLDLAGVRELVDQLNSRLGVSLDAKNELLAQSSFDAQATH